MGYIIMMKDYSRDHLQARDNIRANLDLIIKYTIDIQRSVGEFQELLTLISWYLDTEMTKIDKHYNDSPLEHLKHVSNEYSDYCGELVNMDTSVRQLIYVLNRRFKVDDPEFDALNKKATGGR